MTCVFLQSFFQVFMKKWYKQLNENLKAKSKSNHNTVTMWGRYKHSIRAYMNNRFRILCRDKHKFLNDIMRKFPGAFWIYHINMFAKNSKFDENPTQFHGKAQPTCYEILNSFKWNVTCHFISNKLELIIQKKRNLNKKGENINLQRKIF